MLLLCCWYVVGMLFVWCCYAVPIDYVHCTAMYDCTPHTVRICSTVRLCTTVRRTLYDSVRLCTIVRRTLFDSVQCTPYDSVRLCTAYFVHRMRYIVPCTPYKVQRTLFIVRDSIYSKYNNKKAQYNFELFRGIWPVKHGTRVDGITNASLGIDTIITTTATSNLRPWKWPLTSNHCYWLR